MLRFVNIIRCIQELYLSNITVRINHDIYIATGDQRRYI